MKAAGGAGFDLFVTTRCCLRSWFGEGWTHGVAMRRTLCTEPVELCMLGRNRGRRRAWFLLSSVLYAGAVYCCIPVFAADGMLVQFVFITSVAAVSCKQLTHHMPYQAFCSAATSAALARGPFARCAPCLACPGQQTALASASARPARLQTAAACSDSS